MEETHCTTRRTRKSLQGRILARHSQIYCALHNRSTERIKAGEHLFDFADAILAETRRIAPLGERLTLSTLRAIELYWIHGEEFKKWRKAQAK